MEVATNAVGTAEFVKVTGENLLQFWESEATRPQIRGASRAGRDALDRCVATDLSACLEHPFRAPEAIREAQWERIRYLVDLAYREIPLYREKYQTAGFHPRDLRTREDFLHVPLVTKDDLIRAGLEKTVSARWPAEELFGTRTFGTSGKTLLVRVNLESIMTDTLQGVRQFWLQSGLKLNPDHWAAMMYTVPWWFESIGGDYPTAFISGVVPPPAVARILDELQPQIFSCYPTNLKAMAELRDEFRRENLYLAVVHSEHSSIHERREWGKALGVPVRDEYSTEEATRIALELPCGHYHVCEDAVYLEVLDPERLVPQTDGEPGLAVVTNLLNEAMPFIRYVQGDLVSRPAVPQRCMLGWSQLATIDGRVNDGFVNLSGRMTPSGTILDVVYRWMFDAGLQIREFELVQTAPDTIQAVFVPGVGATEAKVLNSVGHLRDLLAVCLSHPVVVVADNVRDIPKRPGKRRLIRREFPC